MTTVNGGNYRNTDQWDSTAQGLANYPSQQARGYDSGWYDSEVDYSQPESDTTQPSVSSTAAPLPASVERFCHPRTYGVNDVEIVVVSKTAEYAVRLGDSRAFAESILRDLYGFHLSADILYMTDESSLAEALVEFGRLGSHYVMTVMPRNLHNRTVTVRVFEGPDRLVKEYSDMEMDDAVRSVSQHFRQHYPILTRLREAEFQGPTFYPSAPAEVLRTLTRVAEKSAVPTSSIDAALDYFRKIRIKTAEYEDPNSDSSSRSMDSDVICLPATASRDSVNGSLLRGGSSRPALLPKPDTSYSRDSAVLPKTLLPTPEVDQNRNPAGLLRRSLLPAPEWDTSSRTNTTKGPLLPNPELNRNGEHSLPRSSNPPVSDKVRESLVGLLRAIGVPTDILEPHGPAHPPSNSFGPSTGTFHQSSNQPVPHTSIGQSQSSRQIPPVKDGQAGLTGDQGALLAALSQVSSLIAARGSTTRVSPVEVALESVHPYQAQFGHRSSRPTFRGATAPGKPYPGGKGTAGVSTAKSDSTAKGVSVFRRSQNIKTDPF